MERFYDDWTTARIASEYAGNLWALARKNNELPADPRYDYLKVNSAKRRGDAPRGTHPGFAKGQDQADEGQGPGPSGAGPPSLPDINTNADEEMMDVPGLFGLRNPSDDENEPGDLDSEGRK